MKTLFLTVAFLIIAANAIAESASVTDALAALRQQALTKIDEDIDMNATAFADAKNIQNSLFWSDWFSPFLEIARAVRVGLDTVSSINEYKSPQDVRDYLKVGINTAQSAGSFTTFFSSYDRVKQDAENLAITIDGPAYSYQTSAMLDRAEETGTPFFNYESYKASIVGDLLGINGYANPLPVSRKSTTVDRRGGEVISTIHQARLALANKIGELISLMQVTSLSSTQVDQLNSFINSRRNDVLTARSGNRQINYVATLWNGGKRVNRNVSYSLGLPRSLNNWRTQMLVAFADNTAVEMHIRLREAIGDAVEPLAEKGIQSAIKTLNLRLSIEAVVAGQAGANLIAGDAAALTISKLIEADDTGFDATRILQSNARNQVNMIPQNMMDILPGEVSKLMMLIDDTCEYVRSVAFPAPVISQFQPIILSTQPLGQTQRITVTGENFTASSRLHFDDGVNPVYSDRIPQSWSATQLTYDIAVGPSPGAWTVKVTTENGESQPFGFQVLNTQAQLTSLSVQGASSFNEGALSAYTATAFFDNGTSSNVTSAVVWGENSAVTTISSTGLLNSGLVSADTFVTVSASYTYAGGTRTASKTVTVLNSGGSGPQNVELIVNGGFESGTAGWTMAGAVVKQSGAYPKSGSNYAILGETNNTVDVMYQQFTIPTNATSATLNYYLNIVSAEGTGMEYDIIETSLRTSSGNLLQLIEHKSNVNKAAGPGNPYYVKGTLDLTPWKGQTVRFHVLGQTDSNTLTSFKLDDVSAVAVLPAASQPTYPEIEITSGGEVIPHGSTGTDSNTDFGKHTMEQTTALRSFRVYNRGDGILNLTGSPKVRVVGSSSFILEEEPSASSVAAGEYVSFKIRFNPASGGIHQATVQVESNASNISNYTFAIRGEGVFFDGTPPVVAITSPTTGSAWSTGSGTLSLSGSATDNQQVGQVSWSNDRGGGGTATGTTSWSASGIPLKSGLNVIMVTALDGVGNISTDSLTVTYTPTTPEITVQPGTLSQSIARGSNGSSQTFTVANTGSGTMNYTVTVTSGASWLVVTPGNGTITSGQNTITVSYNTAALPAGAHAGTIQVAAAGAVNSPVTIPVSVNVSAVPPTTPWEGKWASGAATAEVVASAPAQGNGTLLVGTFSGSVTAGGQMLTSSGNEDFFVVKLDANRQAVWVKQFGGTDSEEIYSCQQHPAGGWVISGYFKSTFSMGSQSLTAAGNRDAFLARLDENGNVLWAKRGGGTGIDYGSFALVDGTGNCFLVGKFTTSANFTGGSTTLTANGTRFDLFVTKYSANGEFVWAKSCGGSQYDDVYCAAADANGNVYIGGIFELQAAYGPFTLTVQGNTASWDGFAAKFNAGGTVVWAKRFGEPTGNSSTDYVQFISPGPDGGCYLGGGYDGPMSTEGKTLPRAAGISAFVGHVSPADTLDWIVPIASSGAIGSIMRATHGMVVTAENSLVFGGSYHGEAVFGSSTLPLIGGPIGAENIYFGKIDASGAALWAIPAYSLDGSNLVSICPGNGERVKFFGQFGNPAYFPGLAPVNGDSSKHLVGEIGPPDILSPPSLSDTANFLINEDNTTTVSFTLGDEDTPLGDLVVTAVSSNTTLVLPAGLSLSGAGASRQLGITPVANAYGDTTITLSVTDGVHSVSDTFVLTVVAVNDPPSKPANLLPANIAKNQWTTPLLEAGPYSDLEGDAHSASLWQVLSTDGQVIIWDSGEDAVNKNNRSVAEGVLENGTTYQWRVRYKDSQGGWSAFSDSTSFSTVETYESYRRQRFSQAERSAPGFSATNADPEGDGMPNLLEYAFGSDPKKKDTETVRPSGGAQDGHLTFTYIRRTDTADLIYSVELSDDLIHWESQPGMLEEVLVTTVDSNRERVTMRDTSPMSSKSRRFVRLNVRQQ